MIPGRLLTAFLQDRSCHVRRPIRCLSYLHVHWEPRPGFVSFLCFFARLFLSYVRRNDCRRMCTLLLFCVWHTQEGANHKKNSCTFLGSSLFCPSICPLTHTYDNILGHIQLECNPYKLKTLHEKIHITALCTTAAESSGQPIGRRKGRVRLS